MITTITKRLDALERRLPALPASMLRLQRTINRRVLCGARDLAGTAAKSVGTVAKSGETAMKATIGQARAQARITSDTAVSESERLADAVDDKADTSPDGPYESWTKNELYDRAQELDIEGRSTMSKQQLVKALRAA